MLKQLAISMLAILPGPANACFYCCDTYDLADPGAWGLKNPTQYKYVLGQIASVESLKGSTNYPTVLVTIDVLKDYRYPVGEAKVEALADDSACFPPPEVGTFGKFGIDTSGPMPKLIRAHHSF